MRNCDHSCGRMAPGAGGSEGMYGLPKQTWDALIKRGRVG